MKRQKHAFMALMAASILGAAAVCAATYSVVEVKSTTPQGLAGVGVALATYAEVSGALPATATVVVSRISGAVTSTVASVTCTGGNGAAAAESNLYLVAGDYLLQSGATNTPTVRLIVTE